MPSLRILLLVLLCTNCLPTLAESQRTLLYDYDEAGNLIAVRTTDVGGGPIIDTVTPLFLRRDVSTRFVVSGLNLSLVQISSASPEILISNINFISDTTADFCPGEAVTAGFFGSGGAGAFAQGTLTSNGEEVIATGTIGAGGGASGGSMMCITRTVCVN